MIYLIRHAEKLDNSVHSKLTEKGLKDSFLYGKKIKDNNVKIDLIISSPIERCLQTAQEISNGYGGIQIEESTLLGNPGIFVNDGDKAMEIFNQYRLLDIINMQLSEQPLAGFNDIKIATQKLIQFMEKRDINIMYISHDAIITPFISYILNSKKIKKNDIVKYLCGYINNTKILSKSWIEQDDFIYN